MDLTPSTLFANVLVSAVGFGIFLYGKKQRRLPQLVAGVLLMGYPYFVGGAFTMLAIGVGIVVALWIGVRAGL
jgi:hypothetical protein